MNEFELLPAIDLYSGKVVRLKQGDINQQTIYDENPASRAKQWIEAGAKWLHIVNLDGALDAKHAKTFKAIEDICLIAKPQSIKIQLGGGMRSLADVETAFKLGVWRVIFGTAAVEQPRLVKQALENFGDDSIAISIDAKDGMLRTHGWVTNTQIHAVQFARSWAEHGLKWIIYTDISRDGIGRGININSTKVLVQESECNIIASGGANSLEDILQAKNIGCKGIILGRALYDGVLSLSECFNKLQKE